jgi:membrane protein DedA with SNARE-associated domain
VFATAGMNRMRLGTFLLWDGLGACISVPVMVTLGYAFSDHVDRVRAGVAHVEHWALATLAVALAVYALASGGRRILRRQHGRHG